MSVLSEDLPSRLCSHVDSVKNTPSELVYRLWMDGSMVDVETIRSRSKSSTERPDIFESYCDTVLVPASQIRQHGKHTKAEIHSTFPLDKGGLV